MGPVPVLLVLLLGCFCAQPVACREPWEPHQAAARAEAALRLRDPAVFLSFLEDIVAADAAELRATGQQRTPPALARVPPAARAPASSPSAALAPSLLEARSSGSRVAQRLLSESRERVIPHGKCFLLLNTYLGACVPLSEAKGE